jgi:hypothetical protein
MWCHNKLELIIARISLYVISNKKVSVQMRTNVRTNHIIVGTILCVISNKTNVVSDKSEQGSELVVIIA